MTDEPLIEFDLVNSWQLHRPAIEKALVAMGGSFRQDDVLKLILNGKMHFWVEKNAFAITEVEQYPRKRYLNIFHAGGDLAAVKELEAKITDFAKAIKCDAVVAYARKGWLRDTGDWEVISHRVRKNLTADEPELDFEKEVA